MKILHNEKVYEDSQIKAMSGFDPEVEAALETIEAILILGMPVVTPQVKPAEEPKMVLKYID